MLAYNRHAAAEIRERLRRLIGEEAAYVTVSTIHALAMRLVGASYAGARNEALDFDGLLKEAVRLLRRRSSRRSRRRKPCRKLPDRGLPLDLVDRLPRTLALASMLLSPRSPGAASKTPTSGSACSRWAMTIRTSTPSPAPVHLPSPV
ncbi:MAG: AAA family ATPase [Paracoccaceae bacterium]